MLALLGRIIVTVSGGSLRLAGGFLWLVPSLVFRLVFQWKQRAVLRGIGHPMIVPSARPVRLPIWLAWQVPVFMAGVAVFCWVLGTQHDWKIPWNGGFDQPLAAASKALQTGDTQTAVALIQQALHDGGQASKQAGDLHFMLGSAYLAEAAGASELERAPAAEQALAEFQQAESLGMSSARHQRLAYQMGKARYLSGGDPKRAAEAIENALETNATDALDGYQLLTRIYLEHKEPNLEAALRANEKLLALPELGNSNPARLQRGQILLRLKRLEEAGQILDRIPPGAPEYLESRHACALCLLESEDWASAARLWGQISDLQELPAANRGQCLYYLGLCHARLQRGDDALRVWQEVRDQMPESHAAQAAAFQLGDLKRRLNKNDEAAQYFKTALESVQEPYDNQLLDLNAARLLLGAALAAWFEAGEFESIRNLSELYHRIAMPGEAERCFAFASQAAGFARLRESEQQAGAASEKLLQEARDYFREAGEAFESVARHWEGQPIFGEMTWAAAENYLRSRHYDLAVPVLQRYLALKTPDIHQTEALVGLGEAYKALKQTDDAIRVLNDAIKMPGPLNCRARYLLALAYIEQAKFAEAETTLHEIVKVAPPDPEPIEFRQSLYALGFLLYRQSRYAEAAPQLERALEQYPDEPQALSARYRLAEAYRQSALQEEKVRDSTQTGAATGFYQGQRNHGMEKALEHFQHLTFRLSDQQSARALSAREKDILRESRLGIGGCLTALGRYSDAISVYDELANDYHDQTESLYALAEIVRCYRALRKSSETRKALERFRTTLETMDGGHFQPPQLTRGQWLEWLETASAKVNGVETPALPKLPTDEPTAAERR